MASLSLRHIYKKYPGGVTAVSDFNLEIKDKEFIVFVGPSGCGKSTTLRMIAGLEEISEGELFIGDRLVNDVAPKDRKIAMVFQNYALYPHMTVFENMAFGLKLNKTPKEEIKRRVEEAARVLDITHLLDRKPKALSGGQKQRVALGRAIVRNPKVFLLDERNTLLLTTGKSLRLSVEKVSDIEDTSSLFYAALDLFLGGLIELKAECHVLKYSHMGIKSVVLENHRDLSILRSYVVNELVADEELTLGDFLKTCYHSESGGLTATGRTYEYEKLLILDFKVEVRYSGNSAGILLIDVLKGYTCHL